jgi:hypothetical protein
MTNRHSQTSEGRTRFQRHVLEVQMTVRALAAAEAKIAGKPYLPWGAVK